MKLQTKLLILFGSLGLVSGTLLLLMTDQVVNTVLLNETAKRGLVKFDNLSEIAVSSFESENETVLLGFLQLLQERMEATHAAFLDQDGRVVAHTNVVLKGALLQDPGTQAALRSREPGYQTIRLKDGSVLDVFIPLWRKGVRDSEEEFLLLGGEDPETFTRLGTLRIGISLDETIDIANQISRKIVLVLLILWGVSLGVLLFFIRQTIRKIHALSEGTKRLRAGEYGFEVQIESKDELGELARGFNRMSWDLGAAHSQLEQQVKARTQELESFVHTISHDLRSPVVSMQGMASLLLEDQGDDLTESAKFYVNRVIANANYMEELIEGLLVLSRIGRKQEDPEMATLDQVIQEILEVHGSYFSQKGIEVVVHRPLPYLVFEKIHLRQVFQNLMMNAGKFMGDQPHPRVEVGGREGEREVEIYVKDNGIGIDPAYHSQIFGVFSRLKELDVQGTGVGLSIVKKVVHLAGGKVWLKSAKGQGATFYLQFPRTQTRPKQKKEDAS